MNESGVVRMVQAKAEKAGGPNKLAKEWDMSQQYVRGVMSARYPPGKRMLTFLGLERVVSYRVKGGQ